MHGVGLNLPLFELIGSDSQSDESPGVILFCYLQWTLTKAMEPLFKTCDLWMINSTGVLGTH